MSFGDVDLATISDREMTNLRGNRMAMVFQEPMTSLNPAYTIGNQLEEALLRHRKVPVSQARERAVASAWRPSASPPRASACANTRTSSPAACASA